MKKILLFICLLFTFSSAFTQNAVNKISEREGTISKEERAASTITVNELKRHLSILASDEYEGRETGTKGQRKAADYIANIFASYDLPKVGDEGTYFQNFSFLAENWRKIKLSVHGEEITHLGDFFSIPAKNSALDITSDEITFLGYGIDDEKYSDYKGKNVQGKVLLIADGEPFNNNTYLLTKSDKSSEWSKDLNKKLKAAKKHGAKAVFIVSDDYKAQKAALSKDIRSHRRKMRFSEKPKDNYANSCYISKSLAKTITGKKYNKVKKALRKINKKGKAKSFAISTNISLLQKKSVNELLGSNVIGYIEGSDEKLKEEFVFITAHYDHLGVREDKIYNGADDNGSGTASLLEICQAFKEAKQNGWGPKRTVVVMLVSGEEKGLLGSKYYVNFPTFPLENTVVEINVDMIGRVDKKHEGNPDYIYVIGADRLSSELHEINEKANSTFTHLELDYTYNEESDPNRYYYRSDHYNFAEKGIPSVFYFNGTHEDYHRASDTIEKINFEKMEKIAKLVFHTAWEIANRDNRIIVDKK